jgi:hypothetical protein
MVNRLIDTARRTRSSSMTPTMPCSIKTKELERRFSRRAYRFGSSTSWMIHAEPS